MALSDNAMIAVTDVGLYTGGNVPGAATPTTTTKEQYIESASDYIRAYCDRDFMEQDYVEYHRFTGQRLTLSGFPIVEITSIEIDDSEIESTEYSIVDALTGIVEFEYWIKEDELVKVTYTAGFVKTASTGHYLLPYDLKYACIILIPLLIQQASGRVAQSEALDVVHQLLDKYKDYR